MKHTTGGAAATKTGPNNAKCIVWAISEVFYSFLLLFWILTKVYSIYNGNLRNMQWEEWQRQKRAQPMHLLLFGP